MAILLFGLLQSLSVFGWNAVGHRVIAQIAYDHMTVHAKQVFSQYNHALDKIYKPQNFIQAAVWLDMLRYQDISWFATMHYMDIPFSDDGSPLPAPQEINALWAIEKARALLLNKYPTDFDKGIAFRVLLHVVGDIHQPMHVVSRISSAYPEGDRGGNLVILRDNPVAPNLHAYWDRGAGLLNSKKLRGQAQLTAFATGIEERWPCDEPNGANINPKTWADESHELAVKKAYQLPINSQYQDSAQKISEQRMAQAGCRLAILLNTIDEELANKPLIKRKHHRRRGKN